MKLLLGLILGVAFGAVLQLGGASSHTKIVNALRLRDLTIIKLILVAIGVGLIGIHLLDSIGLANMKVKDLYLPGVAIAGLIFGIGFAVSGYCPGTALAAAAEGKVDAWFTVAGGVFGAVIFAFLYPELESVLLSFGQFGPLTLHQVFAVPGVVIAVPLGAICIWIAMRLPESGIGTGTGSTGASPARR